MTTTALYASAAAPAGTASRTLLEHAFAACLGLLLFGDYLALSVSRLITGTPGNWIACAAGVQLLCVPLAVLLGRLRGVLRQGEVQWFLALGVLMLGHVVVGELTGHGLNDYGNEKVAAWFALCGPALLCGLAVGHASRPPGGVWLLVFCSPLLLGCALSVASDPAQLTIAYFNRLHVHFGVLVQPAHQSLAFVLAKAALACCAWWWVHDRGSLASRATLGALGVLLGLLVLSGARGYILAFGAATVVLWTLGRGQLWLALGASVVGFALFHYGSSEAVQERFDPSQVLESLAYQERVNAWGTAWDAWLAAPLVGHGPGGFADFDSWGYRTYPHNILLEFASELGLVGLLCFLGLLGTTARRIWLVRHEGLNGARVFAFGFLLFALVGAQSVGDLMRNYFVFFSIGLAVAATRSPLGGPQQ